MKKALTISALAIVISFSAYAECTSPISEESFNMELSHIKSHDFDEAKKEAIAKLFSMCLTSEQVKTLLSELSFEEDKLELAKKAFKNVSDPANYGVVKDVLDFDDSKKEIDSLMK